jgi:hypothetical protein
MDYPGRVPPAPATTSLPPMPSGFAGPGNMPPAAARPPVWPPVASEPGMTDVPSLPERLSASLDMTSTSELPKMRDYEEPPAPPSRYSEDLTMELPIFQELESAWFRSGPLPDESDWPRDGSGGSMVGSSAGTAYRAGQSNGTDGVSGYTDEVTWRSAADEGWLAAQAALEPQDGGVTETGLPRRVPLAQLVPGGVETQAPATDRRTPDSVRGLLSAYHRGVQAGRSAHGHPEDATESSLADQSEMSQTSGKEQEA